jgi:hypothetical protein
MPCCDLTSSACGTIIELLVIPTWRSSRPTCTAHRGTVGNPTAFFVTSVDARSHARTSFSFLAHKRDYGKSTRAEVPIFCCSLGKLSRPLVSHFRLGSFSGFLQSMPALHPDLWIAWLDVECVPVIPDSKFPFPSIASTIGESNRRRPPILPVETVHEVPPQRMSP